MRPPWRAPGWRARSSAWRRRSETQGALKAYWPEGCLRVFLLQERRAKRLSFVAFSKDVVCWVLCRESNDYGWPGNGALLQLRLWAATFPLSDKRHPVRIPYYFSHVLLNCLAS